MADKGKDILPSKLTLDSLVEQAERSTSRGKVPKMVNPKRQTELNDTIAASDPKQREIDKAKRDFYAGIITLEQFRQRTGQG